MAPRLPDILELLAEGLTNADIGRRIFLSEHTVKIHVERLYRILGVHSRAAAVAQGFRQGLLT